MSPCRHSREDTVVEGSSRCEEELLPNGEG
jgi:hypothetical protein